MGPSHTNFPANFPHFFKIILSHNLQDTGLRIPNKFMREHGKDMSNQISVRVSDGRLWPVELTNYTKNGEVWLKNGWHKFADHYSIRCGHFLVFGYEGNSVFNVLIFDKSATEIKYPTVARSNRDLQKGTAAGIQTDDDLSTRKKSPVAYFLRSKKPKMENESEEGELNEEFKGSQTEINEAIKMKLGENFNSCLQGARVKKDGDSTAMETKARGSDHAAKCREALWLANAFISKIKKNPFFLVTLKPSYVSLRYSLSIPGSFAVRYLNKTKHKNCILQLCDGRTWGAKCTVYPRQYAKMDGGWKKFALDNALAVGDVCVFELISSDIDILFKVSIFQAR